MWTHYTRLRAIALASGLAGLSSIAIAQQANDPHHPPGTAQTQPQPPGRGMMGMMRPGMMGMMSSQGMMGQGMLRGGMMDMMAGCAVTGDRASMHAEGRVAFIKAELAITDAQTAVWETYAAALKKNFASMQAGQQRMASMMAAKTSVERLDAQIALVESRHTALKEIKGPLDTLYAALTAEQKARADLLLTAMGCM